MDHPALPVVETLARLSLLRGLDPALCARLAAGATVSQVPRGSIVFRHGEPCTGLHVVVSGQVKLSLQADHGHEKIFDLIGADGSFGEPALYLGLPHQVSAEAIADSVLVHLAREGLLQEIADSRELSARVIRALAARIHSRTDDLKNYMMLSGTQRVIGYLLHALPANTAESAEVALTLPTRKGIIAAKLNLTQEHFSRILRELALEALIQVDGSRVRIRDVSRLRASITH